MSCLWFSVFFIVLLEYFTVCGQYVQSPCPQIFDYKSDNTGIYGTIHLQPFGYVNSVTLKANFTIATRLPSSYVGNIQLLSQELNVLQDFNRGAPIDYRVNFPVSSPLPRLTGLSANDNLLCYGSGDIPGPAQYVTTISLQHSLFLRNDFNGVYEPHRPTYPSDNQFHIEKINQPNRQSEFEVYKISQQTPVYKQPPPPPPPRRPEIIYAEIITERPQRPPPPPPPYREPEYEVYETPIFTNEQEFERPIVIPPKRTQRPKIKTTTTTTTEAPRTIPNPEPLNTQSSSQYDTCGVTSENVPLIFQGSSYQRGDWPWLVAIYRRRTSSLSYICSGTLVSDQHIITAAHCMQGKNSITSIKDIVVKVGVYNLEDWGDDITVTLKLSSAAIHESYNATNLANDILVMTLERPVTFNANIIPACLWTSNADLNRIVGTTGVVTGWGASELGPGGSGEPRMVRMPVVSTKECRASKPEFHRLTSHKTLCAGDKKGAGPCLGDSGGGLYILDNGRWRLRGVVSLSLVSQNGDHTCNLNEYVVFTDTAQYIPWIKEKMKKDT
ncbi:serine protease gd-like [Zerene cesonia]|uniref:serine protease gd-like n=1 Tax=Zerene cesonia TaxID=33412 RepID=UPI0018E5869C|nr:serine protease gd-like [Zerene cesonia]